VARTLALMLVCFSLVGCELVANFDRSKVPSAHADAGAPDAGAPDAGEQHDAAPIVSDDAGNEDGG
jgi:hypothetical protein